MIGPAAQSADTSAWANYSGTTYGTGIGYFMGSYKAGAGDGKGEIAWCALDQDRLRPSAAPSSVTWGDVKYASSWTPDGGTALSATTIARVAYLLATYGETTSDSRAKSLYYVLHKKAGLDSKSFNLTQAQMDAGDDLWAEAVDYAGPYTSVLTIDPADVPNRAGLAEGTVGSKSAVITYGIKASSGKYAPGYTQVLKITGPGKFSDSTGTLSSDGKTLTINSATTSRSRTITATGHGTISVAMTTSAPDTRVVYRSPTSGTYQRMWLAGQMRSVPDSTSFTGTAPWDYSIATRALNTTDGTQATTTAAVAAGVGDKVGDRLSVSVDGTWPSGYEVDVTSTLYGPLNSAPSTSSGVPSGTPVAGTVTTTITGSGTYTTPTITISKPGYYVWRETAPATTYASAWASAYGQTIESALTPWAPTLTTQVSAATAAPGTDVTDKVTVTGHRPGQAITVTAKLYYAGANQPTAAAAVPGTATLVVTRTVSGTVGANGSVVLTTPAYTLPAGANRGYYTWVASVPAIAGTSSAYTARYGEATETFVVPWSPSATTTASSTAATPGGVVSDQVAITGHRPGQAVTVTAKLYYAGTTAPAQQGTVPTGAQLMTSQTATGTVAANGTLTLTTAGYTLPTSAPRGYYTWVASLPAITGISSAYTHAYGVPAETFLVPWTPNVTTQASSLDAMRGQQVRDTIVLAGHRPGSTVTATARLYFAGADRPTEQPAVPGSAQLLETYSVPLTAGATGSATAVTPWYTIANTAVPGYYTWVVSIPAVDGAAAFTAPYGVSAETFRLRDAQLIATTETSDAIASGGAQLRDIITLNTTSDLGTYPAVVTSNLWGPFDAPPEASELVPRWAPLVGTVTRVRTSPGQFTTDPVTLPNRSGFYVWTAHVAATADYDEYNSQFGEATETTLVPWQPKVATQTSDARALAGDAISDRLEVTDARPGVELVVTSTLYGPLTEYPSYGGLPPAGTPVVSTVATAVTPGADGSVTATTEEVVVPSSGIYVWHEVIEALPDGSSLPWAGEFGETTETTLVPWQPQVTTQTSDAVAAPGLLLSDDLSVTDLRPGIAVDVVSDLYGPFVNVPELSADVPDGAPLVGTVTTSVTADASGSAQATTDALELPASGYYVWVEHIAATSTTEAWQAPFGQTIETTLAPWSPEVATQTSQAVAQPGYDLFDRLQVSSGRPGVELEVISTLYGPFRTAPELQDDVPADAPVVGTVSTLVTPDADGTASVSTDTVVVTARGFYVWHETIAAANDGTSVAWSAPFGRASETTLVPWQPQVTTQTSDVIVDPGTELTDTLNVTGLPPGQTVDVVSTLYGPLPRQPQLTSDLPVVVTRHPVTPKGAKMATAAVHGYVDHAPADTPVAGTVTTTVTGGADGSVTAVSPGVVVTASGYYVWHETIAASDDDTSLAWAAPYGQVNETSLVPWAPKVVTQTSDAIAEPGTALTDSLEVSGLQPSTSVSVESTLYGPFTSKPTESADVPDGAPVVGTVSTQVSSNKDGTATAVTDALVVTARGYYVWVETIAAATDGTHTGWVARFGQASETTLVLWAPTVVTQASQARAGVGSTLYDTLVVDGVPSGAQLDVVSTLYGPFGQQPVESATVPDDAPVVGKVTTAVTSSGTYRTETIRVDDEGYYVWHETIAATDLTHAWAGRFGVSAESTYVWKSSPTVVTKASQARAGVGSALYDTLIVDGVPAGAQLEVESTLYGPFAKAPVESATVPDDAPVAGKVTTAVTSSGTYRTKTIRVDDEGYYVWHETIGATALTHAWAGRFGVAAETTRIQGATVSTVATSQTGPGQDVQDTATVAGLVRDGAYLTFRAYGPLKEGATPVCTDETLRWTSERVDVTAAGAYSSGRTTVREPGVYYWVETLYDASGEPTHIGACGADREITRVHGLPVTGSEAGPVVGIAALLLLTGAGVYAFARRRRSDQGFCG